MPSFKEILGHDREKDLLKRAVLSGRVAHAYLFAGLSGTGKRRLALALSSVLNCSRPAEGDACGVCQDCDKASSGSHENITEVWPTDKDGSRADDGLIRVEEVRELQDSLKYRVERGKKTVIIEAADKMKAEAANAFLKTLEEPPADSLIILVSSRPSYLLPTILSRCQRINFRPLPESVVRGYLVEERGILGGEADTVARMSAGSLAKALNYIDTGALEKRRGLAGRLRSLKEADTLEILSMAEELSRLDDLEEVLEFFKTVVRDKAVSSAGLPQLIVNRDMEDLLRTEGGSVNGLLASFEMIEAVRYDTTPPRYANKQLALEALLIRLKDASLLV